MSESLVLISICRLAESLERDQLYTTAVPTVVPRSDFLIRNRYLSRIGARVSTHFSSFFIASALLH